MHHGQHSYAAVAAVPGKTAARSHFSSKFQDDVLSLSHLYDEDMTSTDYSTRLLDRFYQFRLEGMFCDFTLRVQHKSFQVLILNNYQVII